MHVLFVLLETALQILMPQVYSEIIITINCIICLVAKGKILKTMLYNQLNCIHILK